MKNILLIEDDGGRYRTLRYHLNLLYPEGYRIFWAVTEDQLVEYMREVPCFDLVILDHDLGIGNGRDVSDLLSKHDYDLSCMADLFWIWSHNHIQAPKMMDKMMLLENDITTMIAPFETNQDYYKQLVDFMEDQ